jgi:hypothetical protein
MLTQINVQENSGHVEAVIDEERTIKTGGTVNIRITLNETKQAANLANDVKTTESAQPGEDDSGRPEICLSLDILLRRRTHLA